MNKIKFLIFLLILFSAFAVRLYHFSHPVADWHSWRQVDTSSVSRNFAIYGFDILHPTFHDLSIGVSLLDNPKGYRFVEFPFYNIFQAGLFKLFGYLTIEEFGRIVSILASLGMIVFLFLIVKKYISEKAAFFAGIFSAFVPYNVYYGRALLPDTLMVTFMIGGLYFFDKWLETNSKIKDHVSAKASAGKKNTNFKIFIFFILSIIFTASAILMKPFVLFFAPGFLYLAWRKFGFGFIKKIELWIFLIVSVTPFILWRIWMSQYPEGIPQSNWLFNGNGIRFKGAFFHWLFADRISRLILGYFGLPFVILGILAKIKKEGLLFMSMIASSILYMSVIATGNIQHDYYQILIMPTITILFAKGMDFVIEGSKDLFNRFVTYIVIFISLIFMFSFSWYIVRDYYTLQHMDAIYIGMRADKILPKHAKVIAPFGGDTTFLYSVNRIGWPVVDRSFLELINGGAEYFVLANPGKPEKNLANFFGIVEEGKDYLILDLKKLTPRSYEILKPEKIK